MRLVTSATLLLVVLLLIVVRGIISWTKILVLPAFSTIESSSTKMRANSNKYSVNCFICCNKELHNLSNITRSNQYPLANHDMQRKRILTLCNHLFLLSSSTAAGGQALKDVSSIKGKSYLRSISNSVAPSCNNIYEKLPKFRHLHHHPNNYYDIPRKPPNTIRLYLIRHGQTENNRLNIVQGAHVDTPLNDRGKLQAILLGEALISLQLQQKCLRFHHDTDDDEHSLVFVHSTYQRSQETATIAASTYYFNNSANYNNNYRHNMQELPSIGTIDFGLQEKKKYEMNQIYSSWSLGLIDVKLAGGETCRQVIERILQSFHSIVKISSTRSNQTHTKPQEQQKHRDVVAISHRKLIRMMLAIALDIPLFQAFTTLQQRNGCMNILDISTTETITWVASQSKLFLGSRRQLQLNNSHDFQMILPKINVIKVDDNRHLDRY